VRAGAVPAWGRAGVLVGETAQDGVGVRSDTTGGFASALLASGGGG
jgi:hypothetical protein